MGENSATDAVKGPSYLGIGLGLLALVVLILAAAFVLNNHLRPHVGIAPASGTTRSPTPNPVSRTSGTPPAESTAMPSTAIRPTATVRPTPAPSSREAVMRAYHRYWQVYSQALYTLNTSRVSEVAADGELKRVHAEVAGLQQENRAVRVRVSHDALIVSIKRDNATVYDEQHDRSFLIDAVTKGPNQGSNQITVEKDIYFFRKIQGTWKVLKSLRAR